MTCTSAAPAGKSQLSAPVHEMHFCSSSRKAAQLQLEVATFQYQASTLTSAALRKYLPSQSKPARSRGLSRTLRETSPTFLKPPANTRTPGAITREAGFKTVASPGFIGGQTRQAALWEPCNCHRQHFACFEVREGKFTGSCGVFASFDSNFLRHGLCKGGPRKVRFLT